MTPTVAQLKWLSWLAAHGGEATVVRQRVHAGDASCGPNQHIAFLNLIAGGAIVGSGGKLWVSAYGYRLLGREPPCTTTS